MGIYYESIQSMHVVNLKRMLHLLDAGVRAHTFQLPLSNVLAILQQCADCYTITRATTTVCEICEI